MFILFPIGHESSSVRRQPWISYGIIVLNFLIFLGTSGGGSDNKTINDHVNRIFDYMIEYPHTTIPPDFAELLSKDTIAQLEVLRLTKLDEMVPPDAAQLEEQQEGLERLIRQLYTLLGNESFERWGYIPGESGRLYTLVTSVFFHAGWMHLLGNMLLLFLTGPFIEDRWGRGVFLVFYLVCGGVAAAMHGVLTLTPDSPLIGASGAIAGLMGTFLIFFSKTRITFFYMIPFLFFRRGTFQVPSYTVLPLWFLQQLIYASTAIDSGVAFWAHVGGFAFGFAVGGVMKLLKIEENYLTPRLENKDVLFQAHPDFDRAVKLLASDQSQQGVSLLKKIIRENPNDSGAIEVLYHHVSHDFTATATGTLQLVASRHIVHLLKIGEIEDAVQVYQNLSDRTPPVALTARALYSLGTAMDKSARFREAVDIYERLVKDHGSNSLAATALVQIASFYEKQYGQQPRSIQAFQQALLHPACDPNARQMIEDKLRRAEIQTSPVQKEPPTTSQANVKAGDSEQGVQETTNMALLDTIPVILKALKGDELTLQDKKRRILTIRWDTIDHVVVGKLARTGKESVEIIEFVTKNDDPTVGARYRGFRLSCNGLPLKELFPHVESEHEAFLLFCGSVNLKIMGTLIPEIESLRKGSIPFYETVSDFRRFLESILTS